MSVARSASVRYGVAVAATCVALAGRFALVPVWGPLPLVFITFYPAVMASAWFGGFGPGLIATVLSAFSARYFFIEPRFAFDIPAVTDIVALGVFVSIGVFISALPEARLRALRRAEIAAAASQAARDELTHRVAGLTLLAELSTRLVQKGELHGALAEILDTAVRITGADMGTIQLGDVRTGHLEIAVQRGFEAEFLHFFATVHEHGAACGTAMATAQRVIVEDVAQHPIFAGTDAQGVLLRAGVRAVQSTPLWGRPGELLGMLSTYYRRPHRPDERDLQLLDVLSRLAADYIERVRAEQWAETTRVQLEAANRAKDEFLAMLGHELRNPLGAISGAMGVLSVVGATDDTADRARAVIARQVQHLSRLVDDLLDVSRVTSGKVRLSRQPLDLAEIVGDAMNTWRAAGRLDRHQLVVDAVPVWVDADETRIEQVLSNLLGNALKYTPAGGQVTVRVAADDHAAILEVADTGAGIPASLIDVVFDSFVQGDRGLDRSQGGLGLGLTLVKALVELHGGTVHAHSLGTGKGSAFTVRLARVPAPARPAQPRRRAPASGRALRILIVEDNEDAREMLRVQLTLAGHEVHDAADGPTGVAQARALAPDVALVDVGLPGVDGYEVARRIRASDAGRSLRLVAITGYGQAEDRQRALDAGFDTHLTKPVSPEQLFKVLADVAATPPRRDPP
jgi:signal transduction histidine kinase/ActR/RegA family two-component response regulator